MTDKLPSALQQKASKAQSKADRHEASKQLASELQSEADRAAVPKHGL
ncbi:hypothetical protein L1N85_10470 [Paenibacillus alkaliterrae]|nr:hypothetical protein [Paenibacillus alkaliterrae]MCF2938860.1 hypothetical protein [Paenibacillus alkaliterrae]